MKRIIYTIVLGLLTLLLPAAGSLAQPGRNHNKSSVPYRSSYQRMATSCNADFSMEIRNGILWAWGRNNYGQLGIGNTTDQSTPVQIGSATNWVSVACGQYHTAAISSDGKLWVWGFNGDGELGDGTTTDKTAPVQVGTATNWVSVTCGYSHTLAISSDGKLWAWGDNGYGQLGLGNYTSQSSPAQVGTATNWVSVTCGYSHSLAIGSDGKLWAWGFGYYGQLGLGNTTSQSSPMQIGSATNWVSVACGQYYTAAISSDGKLWAWGQNVTGQLGDGTTMQRNAPVQVGTAANWISVACGYSHTLAISSDGKLWAWGYNTYGQLGLGSYTSQSSPVQVGTATNWVSVAGGFYHTLAVSSDGKLWAWGYESYGQLGNGIASTTSGKLSPITVRGSDRTWLQVANGNGPAIALKSDGTLWAWGYDNHGQLGIGNITAQPTPVQVGTATNWTSVACGQYHTLATGADGKLWGWGYNADGELGDGSVTNRTAPAQVGTAANWISVACGQYHSLAISSDGKLWAWGSNVYGQLGNSSSTPAVPVQVGTSTNWVGVACGASHTLAISSDGKLWAWGRNNNGQLGLGNNTDQSSPVQVGTATNWVSVACGGLHTLALNSDGKLWAWGGNVDGELGIGNNTNQSSPVQVSIATSWVSVTCDYTQTLAISSDGKLWAWGYNGYGALGIGNTTNQNSPMQVSSQSDVVSAGPGCSALYSAIIRADRASVCVAGFNGNYQLANGNTTNSSSFSCSNNVCRANSLATASSTSYTQFVPGTGNREDFESGCVLAASVTPSGASPVTGNVTAQAFVDASVQSANTSKYVQRHYDILPATAPNTATATITLYFLQSEFDAYNTAVGSGLKLPTGPADAAGIANLKVTQYHGTPSGGNGPANYPATWGGSGPAHILIDPVDANIVFNTDDSRWEVTFNVTGFSGFFVNASASSNALPVGLTVFSAKLLTDKDVLLSWSVATPKDGSSYTVERSGDAASFRAIGTIAATLSNECSLNDYAPLGGRSYYRLKITETDGSTSYSNIESIFISNRSYVNVAPSPAHEHFVISTNTTGLTAILSDVQGRVQQRFAVSNDMQVDISTLPAGVYLLKISSGEVMKIVKE